MRYGLLGKDNNKGLGTITNFFIRNFNLCKLFIWTDFQTNNEKIKNATYISNPDSKSFWRENFQDLDVLIILEKPFQKILKLGHKLRKFTILMVNYEYLPLEIEHKPNLFWCTSILNYEKCPFPNKFLLNLPVDTNYFKFKQVTKIQKIAIVVGTDGYQGYNNAELCHTVFNEVVNFYPELELIVYQPNILSHDAIPFPTSVHEKIKIITTTDVGQFTEADLLLIPQNFRACSLPIFEAMASGMIVITSMYSPFSQLLDLECLIPVPKKINSVKNKNLHYILNIDLDLDLDLELVSDSDLDHFVQKNKSFTQPIEYYVNEKNHVIQTLETVLNLSENRIIEISKSNRDKMVSQNWQNFIPEINRICYTYLNKSGYGSSIEKWWYPKTNTYSDQELCIPIKGTNFETPVKSKNLHYENDFSPKIILNLATNTDFNLQQEYEINDQKIMVSRNLEYQILDYNHKLNFNKEVILNRTAKILLPNSENIILYVGSFLLSYSTENHLSQEMEILGYKVLRLQENLVTVDLIIQLSKLILKNLKYVFYTRTWKIEGNVFELWEFYKQNKIPVVTYHLDLYYPIARKKTIPNDPYWSTDYVFITDYDPRAVKYYKQFNYNVINLHAGVFSQETYLASYRGDFKHDIIFVGTTVGYHLEWSYRLDLIDFLKNYSGFCLYGNGGKSVRGHDLNLLYAQTKIVIGDVLCPNFDYEEYWSDRIYETLGRGGFLICPYIKGMEREFINHHHLVFYEYNNFTQLERLIDYYLDHNEERELIRKQGHEFVKNNCTYYHRLKYVFDYINSDLKDKIIQISGNKILERQIKIKNINGNYLSVMDKNSTRSNQKLVCVSHKPSIFIIQEYSVKNYVIKFNDLFLHTHGFILDSGQYEVTVLNLLDGGSIWEICPKNSEKDILLSGYLYSFKNIHYKSYLHTHHILNEYQKNEATTWACSSGLYEWYIELA